MVISDQLWSSWFGRDPSVIGKWYFVSDSMKQVIGVMPPEFHFPERQTRCSGSSGEIRLAEVRPGSVGAPMVARMKQGVTTRAAGGRAHASLEGTARALRRHSRLRAHHRAAPRAS